MHNHVHEICFVVRIEYIGNNHEKDLIILLETCKDTSVTMSYEHIELSFHSLANVHNVTLSPKPAYMLLP